MSLETTQKTIYCEHHNYLQCVESIRVGGRDGCSEIKPCGTETENEHYSCFALFDEVPGYNNTQFVFLSVRYLPDFFYKSNEFIFLRDAFLMRTYVIQTVSPNHGQIRVFYFAAVKKICATKALHTNLRKRVADCKSG